MQAGGKILQSEIQETINSVFSKGELLQGLKAYIIACVHKTTINQSVVIN
jgi:hypothetical protein